MSTSSSEPETGCLADRRSSLESVGCDLCASTNAIEIYRSNTKDDAAAVGEYFSSSRRRATHGRIVKCASCGLVRTSPRDTAETLETVYAQLEDPKYDAETTNRTVTAERELDWVERFQPAVGRLLDVGCSTGIFMAAARARGWAVQGIEASSWAVRVANERFGLKEIHLGFVEDVELVPASFDVITMWDLLEHVRSPTLVLSRAREWLKPDGMLFVNVPNVESTTAWLLRQRWPLLLREHLWYFSSRSLDMALSKTGFRMTHTRANRVTFSLANVFVRLEQYGGLAAPVWRRLARSRMARGVKSSFPIGEISAVASLRPNYSPPA